MKIEYLADRAVSNEDNQTLIALLSTCFTGPHNEVFKSRRYFREIPAHRMVIRDEAGVIKAHIAGHDRRISSEVGELRVLGISEVAVHPDWRGKGLSKKILKEFEVWGGRNGFSFSVLFGDTELYGPQGYKVAGNLAEYIDSESERSVEAILKNLQFKQLGTATWPGGSIHLRGMTW